MSKNEDLNTWKTIWGIIGILCLVLLMTGFTGCKSTSEVTGKKYNPLSSKERKLNELESQIAKLYGDADKAQRNNQVHEARKAYEGILAIYDQNKENKDLKREVEPYCRLGVIMETFGQYDVAENYYREAMEIDPKNPVPLNNLGYCYLNQHRLDDAIEFFQKAVDLEPLGPKYNNNLGLAYGMKKEYDKAFKCFRRVTSEDEAYYNLSALFAMNNEEEKAKAALEQVVAINPMHREARRMLSSYSESEQNPDAFNEKMAAGNYIGEMVPYQEAQPSASVGSSAEGGVPAGNSGSMPGTAGAPAFTRTYGSIHSLNH